MESFSWEAQEALRFWSYIWEYSFHAATANKIEIYQVWTVTFRVKILGKLENRQI